MMRDTLEAAATEPAVREPPRRPFAARGSSRRALLAAASIVPLLITLAGVGISWRATWRQAEQEVGREADAAAEFVRRTLDGMLLRIDRANGILSEMSDAQIRAREQELHLALRRAGTARARWSGEREPFLFVYDRDGNPLVAGNIFPVGPLGNFADRSFNQALRAADAPAIDISPVYRGRIESTLFFAISVRRERTGNGLPPGSYDGVVTGSLYVDEWEAALARLAAAPGDILGVGRLDGLILARTVPVPPGTVVPPDNALLLAMQAGQARADSLSTVVDGVGRIASYRRVEGYPIFAAAARPRDIVWRSWFGGVLPLLAAGLSASLAMLWLALLVSRQQAALAHANETLEGRVNRRTAALLESEKRLKETLDTLDLAPFLGRDQAGAIRFWSEGATRLYGWSAAEALGHSSHQLLRTESDTPAADIEAALLREGSWQGDLRRITKEGRRIIVNSHKVLRRAADGTPGLILAVDTDVTSHRATEAALADSAARLRLAQEAGEVGIWDWDVTGGALVWSETCHRIHGTPPGMPLSLDLWEGLIHPADVPAMRGWTAAMLAGGERSSAPAMRIRRPEDDRERWVVCRGEVLRDAQGRPIRMLGVVLDVTDQRMAEAALRASEARTRLAIEGAGLATWEYDLALGRFSWSARFSAMLGDAAQAREAIPLAEWLRRLHPDDVAATEAALREATTSAADITLELRVRTPSLAWRWVSLHGAVDGAEIARGVAQDVTDRRTAEERQRLLVREVDHRAKNALAVVLAAIRLAKRDDIESFSTAIEGRVAAMARTHELLAQRLWQGTDLLELARAELDPFVLGNGGDARATLSGPSLLIDARAAQAFSMVLHELATNAAKYGALSVPGGTLLFEWGIDDEAGLLRLHWREQGGPRLAGQPARLGFGTQVIEAILQEQLEGEMQHTWHADGLELYIAVPLAGLLTSGEVGSAQPA